MCNSELIGNAMEHEVYTAIWSQKVVEKEKCDVI
jgi:hypothetical protein